jgi:phage portal protein BeeE
MRWPWQKREDTPQINEQALLGALRMLSNPALLGGLNGRGFDLGGDGVKELDQNFEKYLQAQGIFDDVSQCVNAIATTAASIPVVVKEWKNGKPGDVIENVPEHLEMFLWRPNPDQSWSDFWEFGIQQMGYTGEAPFVGLDAAGGYNLGLRTAEVWFQNAAKFSPRYSESRMRSGRGTAELIGYRLELWNGGYEEIPLEAVRVAMRPNPRDPARGLSPLKELERKLNWGYAALEANRSYLASGAFPGIVVTSERTPDVDMRKGFQERFQSDHAGAKNIGKALWLWGQGMKIERMKDSPKDALQLEVLTLMKQAVRSIYQVPPFMLADVEHANWSNSVEQQRFFYENVIKPWNLRILNAVNTSALVPERMILCHDYSDIAALQEDKGLQMERAVKGFAAGLLTTNEAREEIGREAVPDGDDFKAPAPNPFAGLMDDPEPEPEDDVEEEDVKRLGFFGLVRKSRELAALGEKGDARSLRWKAFLLRSQPLENTMAKEWRGLFKQMRAEVLEELNRVTGLAAADAGHMKDAGDPVPPDLGDLFDIEKIREFWMDRIRPLAMRVIGRGAEDALEEVEGEAIAFPVQDPRVAAFIDKQVAERITRISLSRQNEIQEVIRASVEASETVGQLTQRLRSFFDGQAPFWSRRIARTETTSLYNKGAEVGLEDAGVERKEWLSARDEDVRESHEGMDGEAVPLGTDFVFPSGASGPFPGQIDSAEESVNCRCTVIAGF